MPKIQVYQNGNALDEALLALWREWQVGEGVFLSGSTTYRSLYEKAPLSEATFFLADERMVDINQPESTTGMITRLYASRFEEIDFCPPNLRVNYPAEEYDMLLQDWQADGGTFSTALLGIGVEDGHTASLFPKAFATLQDTTDWVVQVEAEAEPRIPRLTLTPSFLRSIPQLIFSARGNSKRAIIRRIFGEGEITPTTILAADALVLLDAEAATELDRSLYTLV